MLRHDIGILCAPTAFGKTVTAAALIARRGVNALVLVHRTELLEQWQTRLQTFLDGAKDLIGIIGAGKLRPTGGSTSPSCSHYPGKARQMRSWKTTGMSSSTNASFETILKRVRARYVLGLTATPTRRDGRQPILFMQCGPIRHTAAPPAGAPQILEAVPCCLPLRASCENDAAIQEVFRLLAGDEARTAAIADEIAHAFEQGSKVLVLTERTDHLDALHVALRDRASPLFVLHGRLSRTQRAKVMTGLDAQEAGGPRVLLATGRLIGEGFDHAPLDTLVLAMPVSWKGTLQQYAGRLHRQHAGKHHVRILDFIDTGHPTLLRMWERRQRGYHAMGYRLAGGGTLDLESRRKRAEKFAQDTMRE